MDKGGNIFTKDISLFCVQCIMDQFTVFPGVKLTMKFIRKYKDKLLWYGIDLLLLLAFWGGMLRKSFNCDTLSHMLAEDADILHSIRGGRYITALGNYLLLQIGVRTTTNLSITMSAAFLLLALAMLKM